MLRYLPFLLILALWIYAFIDCLNTPEEEIRKLPKVAWVIIILLFGQVLLGPVAWLWVGRPRAHRPYGATKPNERRWVAPDDNPDFLKSLQDGPQDRPQGDRDTAAESEPPQSPDTDPASSDTSSDRAADAKGRSTPPEDETLFRQWEADLGEADLDAGQDEVRDRDGDSGGKKSGPDDTPSSS